MVGSTPPESGLAEPPGPRFPALAAAVVERTLVSHPDDATYLGDHRYDDRLPDPSFAAASARAVELTGHLRDLSAVVTSSPDEDVDAAVLGTAIRAELFDLEQVHAAEWDPMQHNPGSALYALTSREFAPFSDRVASLSGRLAAVPDYLLAARDRLGDMSLVHLDTALGQLGGTISLIDAAMVDVAERVPQLRGQVTAVAETASRAVADHVRWLESRRDFARRDPRLGEELFTAKLALALDTAYDPQSLLSRAEAELDRVTDAIVEEAGRLAGIGKPGASTVRDVLTQLAADAPTNESILDLCRAALSETTTFVREHDLVTVYEDPVSVVEMPEIDRGVAVAYCRPPGPLERAALPTEYAVSPTPRDWTAEQVSSFYREYNAHMLQNLTVHEAMPGHALQLMHANRHAASTPVRDVWWSGSFVEGWAVYAEEMMADRGYRSDVSSVAGAALRMQQLKMQLRMIINAIMDVRFHCEDLDKDAAMELMLVRGFQERGEADGKWRRVQLTSTQLSTYYVGYSEVRDLVADVRRARPGVSDRQLHDTVLGRGSPPARHLRTLLLPSADGASAPA
ncbi:MAG: hypothetical protein JWO57_289 [Pseudonocardiales bacterium]|nr:hypothetical protein [Pseudonocardiales bacterium]